MQRDYTEKAPFNERFFKLDGERLSVSKRPKFGNEFESVIPLSSVRSEKDTIWFRLESSKNLCVAPGVLALVGVIIFAKPLYEKSIYLLYSALAFGLISSVVGYFLPKKMKSYAYYHHSGILAFDICESGNPIDSFEEFTNSIDEKILAYQRTSDNADKPRV